MGFVSSRHIAYIVHFGIGERQCMVVKFRYVLFCVGRDYFQKLFMTIIFHKFLFTSQCVHMIQNFNQMFVRTSLCKKLLYSSATKSYTGTVMPFGESI